MNIPQSKQFLLEDKTKAFAFLATLMPDGTPQVTPIWFNTDGDTILINSARGRVKDKNMRARPQVSLAIMDMEDPYNYLQIRGEVVEITEEGAEEHIHALSQKYHGRPYKIPAGEQRVTYRIKPYE